MHPRMWPLVLVLPIFVAAGCVITFPTPQPPVPPPPSPLNGLWNLAIQSTQVPSANIQFDQYGNVAYVTFNYSTSTSVQYTGQQLNASSSLSGSTVTVIYDNRSGISGFLSVGQVQFVGNLNAQNTLATGTANLLGQNVAGGVVATNLGPATMTKY